MALTLPAAADKTTEYEDFYESTLAAPITAADTDIYPTTMPASAAGFLVIDPLGTNPEIIYYNVKGASYVRTPSAVDGEGRGVGNTTPRPYDTGTKIGMYSIAEFYEGIVTGLFMRDGFLQSRHFSASIDPNSWIGTGESWNYVGNNGQKEYQYVVAGDKTTKYSDGMRVRMPRITTVSSQSAQFASASTQYAGKASPANLSFTDDFTCETWYNPDTYSGVSQGLISRRNADVSGFSLSITAAGTIEMIGLNAGAYRLYTSAQSIDLTVWNHIAATMDISGGVYNIYLNGVLIPGALQSLNAMTAIVQPAVDLRLGARKATDTLELANGKLANTRIWSTVRTAAEIKDNMHKDLVGNEAGLVSYYKCNGNFNDSTANANHLTAQGGAIATYADAPLKAVEFGIITARSFAAGNTTITVYTGNIHNAPRENLNGVGYSAARAPYGFPADKSAWSVKMYARADTGAVSMPAYNSFIDTTYQLTVPTGKWRLSRQYGVGQHNTASGAIVFKIYVGISSSNYIEDLTDRTQSGAACNDFDGSTYKCSDITTTSQTIYHMYFVSESGGGVVTYRFYNVVTGTRTSIIAECAYL